MEHDVDTQDGIYFEDIDEGYEVVSPGRTVTEADIVNFAGLSGDYNILHTDAEATKITPFGQRVAHGLLGLSIASGLSARMPRADQHRIVAFLGMTWDFRNPVFIGDTIYLQQTVASKRPTSKPGLGIVVYDVKVVNQRSELCQEGQWKVMYMMRDASPPPSE
jgi:acyl dehydratase